MPGKRPVSDQPANEVLSRLVPEAYQFVIVMWVLHQAACHVYARQVDAYYLVQMVDKCVLDKPKAEHRAANICMGDLFCADCQEALKDVADRFTIRVCYFPATWWQVLISVSDQDLLPLLSPYVFATFQQPGGKS
eukprot:jgi/Chlat1/4086/Chrsp26S04128